MDHLTRNIYVAHPPLLSGCPVSPLEAGMGGEE